MHVPHAFSIDRVASLAFAARRGFGMMCAADARGPMASHVPFHLSFGADGTPHVAFHLARNNPLAALAGNDTPWLLAVQGDDAYVSADWYASPHQVPTWLYQAVHLTGKVQAMAGDELAGHLDALTARHEETLAPKPPWTMAKMPAARREAMMRAIIGLRMNVDDVSGSFKLNQHKSDADHIAVTSSLGAQTSASAQAIARAMMSLRPHAFANGEVGHDISARTAGAEVEETM